jgi:hypothetical protein
LKFDEEPRYVHLRRIFNILFKEKGYTMDYAFDWLVLKDQKKVSDNEAIKLMVNPELKKSGEEKSNL